MPQMAPMMWQTLYIACILLYTIMSSKVFFLTKNINKEKLEKLVEVNKNKWLW